MMIDDSISVLGDVIICLLLLLINITHNTQLDYKGKQRINIIIIPSVFA